MFRGTRLAGYLREAQEKGLRQPATLDAKNTDGLLFRGALENHSVEILNAPSEFWPATQDFVELLDFFVQGGCAFEIQLLTGFFALLLDCGAERSAACFDEMDQTLHFDVVFLFGATGKAGRQAHFHFGVEAPGKSGIAANLDLAAADLEEIENAFGKCLRGAARCEWAVIRASCGRATLVDGNPASDIAARI